MKNIFKSRFSLIAICIVLGILIGSFALCGCRTNYGLLEGMATNDVNEADNSKKKKVYEALDGDTNLTTVSQGSPPALNPETIINDGTQPINVGQIASQLSQYGETLEKKDDNNTLLNAFGKSLSTALPFPVMNKADGDTFACNKENFQVSRPVAWGPINDTESEYVKPEVGVLSSFALFQLN